MSEKGLITFQEVWYSMKAGNENALSFLAGLSLAAVTELPGRFAHSKIGRVFGLMTLVALAAAGCAPLVDGVGPTPVFTPIPETPTLVSPGQAIEFHADVDALGGNFSLRSSEMSSALLSAAYPGAMTKLDELGYDADAMSFVQFQVDDGAGQDEEYVIGIDPKRNEIVMPWAVTADGWGTPETGEDPSGTRYEWSRVSLDQTDDGGFVITTFSGRYLVVSREGGEDGSWSVGLPAKDLNTGKNAVVTQVRGGGGMLFAPAEFLAGEGTGTTDEDPAGAVWNPTTGTIDRTATLESTVSAPTLEQTATPDAPGYLDVLKINWSDSFVGKWNGSGVTLDLEAGVDSSLSGRADGVDFTDNDIFAQKALQMLRAIFQPETTGSANGLADFAALLGDVQMGKPGVEVPSATLKIFNATSSGPAEDITLVPDMGGKNVPGGAHEVKKVNFVYGDWADYNSDTSKATVIDGASWFHLISKSGYGGRVFFDTNSGELFVMMGVRDNRGSTILSEDIAIVTELVIEMLSRQAAGSDLSNLGNLQKWYDRAQIWFGFVKTTN